MPPEDDRNDSAELASEPDQWVTWVRAMLASASAAHRVEGLQEAGLLDSQEAGLKQEGRRGESSLRPRGQAALLLGYLERLGEPYGPPEVSLLCKRSLEHNGIDQVRYAQVLKCSTLKCERLSICFS